MFFFFNDTDNTEIHPYRHTRSLHDALPISSPTATPKATRTPTPTPTRTPTPTPTPRAIAPVLANASFEGGAHAWVATRGSAEVSPIVVGSGTTDRKSTRLNSSHSCASRMPSSA